MKILFDGRVFVHKKNTGIENHALHIFESLKKKIQIDIVIPKYKNKYYSQFWEHFILPFKAKGYDVLFCPSNIAPFLLSKNTKLIVTLHDLAFKDFYKMYSFLFRKYYELLIPRVVKRADIVLTISNFSFNRIQSEFSFLENKLKFIHHGISKNFYYNKTVKKEKFLLYVGSMNDTKNFSSVLKMYEILDEIEYELILVMPTNSIFKLDSSIKDLLEKAKINPNIKIIDFMRQDELCYYYQKAKLFVFPSYHESFGFPILEAMACGTPVVCSNTTSLPEIGKDAVIYCDPYDINDIKEKVQLVLNDEELQKKMIKKGLNRVKQFTWEKCAQRHIEIFNQVSER